MTALCHAAAPDSVRPSVFLGASCTSSVACTASVSTSLAAPFFFLAEGAKQRAQNSTAAQHGLEADRCHEWGFSNSNVLEFERSKCRTRLESLNILKVWRMKSLKFFESFEFAGWREFGVAKFEWESSLEV